MFTSTEVGRDRWAAVDTEGYGVKVHLVVSPDAHSAWAYDTQLARNLSQGDVAGDVWPDGCGYSALVQGF